MSPMGELVVAALLLAACGGGDVAGGGGSDLQSGIPAPVALVDRFESDLVPWTSTGSVAVEINGNDEKLAFKAAGSQAERPFIEPATDYLVEFDLMAESPATISGSLVGVSDQVLATVSFDAAAATGHFSTDAAEPIPFPWTASTYRQMVVRVNHHTNTLTLWNAVNGDASWRRIGSLPYSGGIAAKLRFSGGDAAAFAWVDELRVYAQGTVVIGDSLAAGAMTWSPFPGFPGRLRATEDEQHDVATQLYRLNPEGGWVANRGINAQRTFHIYARRSDVIDQGFKRAVLLVGVNDVALGRATEDIIVDYQSILSVLLEAGVEPVLCTVPPRTAPTPKQVADTDAINQWLRAQASPAVRVADIFSVLVDPETKKLFTWAAGDYVHWTQAGLEAASQEIHRALTAPALP
ncbi:MAG: SGNH/GDSL hydrolase family protein [Nitrospirota bacterium]|nr:SGNH/GDSL hydrolase family protein [Nitrospirota bacterium]